MDNKNMIKIDAQLLNDIKCIITEYANALGGCDHSVGQCMCDVLNIMDRIDVTLGLYKACPTCKGTGHNKSKGLVGMCLACNGEGTVRT